MSTELKSASDFISWTHTQVHLNAIAENAKRRFVKRGDVYWCHFGLNIGSEMSKQTPRPAVIVQNHIANRKSSNTIVVPVTHNAAALPCIVPLTPITDNNGQIILDGQVNTSNIICVSKARLGNYIATLSTAQMRLIDISIAVSLDLFRYYDSEKKKYNRLRKYVESVKKSRNQAQDLLNEIRDFIQNCNFDEICRSKLKKMLDMD